MKYDIGDLVIVDNELWKIIKLDPECHNGQVYKGEDDSGRELWIRESEIQGSKIPKEYIVCEKGILVETKNLIRFSEFPTTLCPQDENITEEYKAAWLKHFTGNTQESLC